MEADKEPGLGMAGHRVDLIVVVDPEFGDQLVHCAQLAPVWVVATPGNIDAWRRLHKTYSGQGERAVGAVTSYEVSGAECRIENLLNIVPKLELHHGQLSDGCFSFPEGFVLEVIGVALTGGMTDALNEWGFSSFAATSGGFRACR